MKKLIFAALIFACGPANTQTADVVGFNLIVKLDGERIGYCQVAEKVKTVTRERWATVVVVNPLWCDWHDEGAPPILPPPRRDDR